MFLGDPLHTVVILDDPAIRWDVIRDFDDFELGECPSRRLLANLLDDSDENRVVSLYILVFWMDFSVAPVVFRVFFLFFLVF